jgi:hypothetical protein
MGLTAERTAKSREHVPIIRFAVFVMALPPHHPFVTASSAAISAAAVVVATAASTPLRRTDGGRHHPHPGALHQAHVPTHARRSFVSAWPRFGAPVLPVLFGGLSAAQVASRRGFRGSSSGRKRNEGGVADAHAWPVAARCYACVRCRALQWSARTDTDRLGRHGSAAELVSAKRAMCRDRQTRATQSQLHVMQLDAIGAHRMRDHGMPAQLHRHAWHEEQVTLSDLCSPGNAL